MKRRVKKEILQREKADIFSFVCDHVQPDDDCFIFVIDAYEAYCEWRERELKERSTISVDSFGKMFPKTFARKNIGRGGRISRGILGVKLV